MASANQSLTTKIMKRRQAASKSPKLLTIIYRCDHLPQILEEAGQTDAVCA